MELACIFQGGVLADLSSTVATLQSVVQGIAQVRSVMQHIHVLNGSSASESLDSSASDHHQSLS